MTADQILTDVRFWAQVAGDAHRTIICPPELESRVKAHVWLRGLAHIVDVHATRFCPDDLLFILDPPGMEALLAQGQVRSLRHF